MQKVTEFLEEAAISSVNGTYKLMGKLAYKCKLISV